MIITVRSSECSIIPLLGYIYTTTFFTANSLTFGHQALVHNLYHHSSRKTHTVQFNLQLPRTFPSTRTIHSLSRLTRLTSCSVTFTYHTSCHNSYYIRCTTDSDFLHMYQKKLVALLAFARLPCTTSSSCRHLWDE